MNIKRKHLVENERNFMLRMDCRKRPRARRVCAPDFAGTRHDFLVGRSEPRGDAPIEVWRHFQPAGVAPDPCVAPRAVTPADVQCVVPGRTCAKLCYAVGRRSGGCENARSNDVPWENATTANFNYPADV